MFCFYFFLVFFKSIYSQSCSGPDYQATDGSDVTISGPCPPYIAVPYISTTVQFICSYNYIVIGPLFPYWNITGFPPTPTFSPSPSGLSLGNNGGTDNNGRTTGYTTLDIDILHFSMTDILNIQCGICSSCSQPSFQSATETTQPAQLIIFGKYIYTVYH